MTPPAPLLARFLEDLRKEETGDEPRIETNRSGGGPHGGRPPDHRSRRPARLRRPRRTLEGVRSRPVSGYDVELLGAMVETEQATAGVPDEMAVLFFLDGREDVYLTVRERDPLE